MDGKYLRICILGKFEQRKFLSIRKTDQYYSMGHCTKITSHWNMWFLFQDVWVVQRTISYTTLVILFYIQCWRYFLCSWFNLNKNNMMWQVCGYSVLISTNTSIVNFHKKIERYFYIPYQRRCVSSSWFILDYIN